MTDPLQPELLHADGRSGYPTPFDDTGDPDTSDGLDDAGVDGDDGEARKRPPPPRWRTLVDWAVVIAVALLVAFVVRTYVLAHFVVDGTSMESTLHHGDRVFVNKIGYRFHDPRRGDVVVLHDGKSDRDRDLIKRVIGLPGETISMIDCEVRIDGVVLDEPYLDEEHRIPGGCGAGVPEQLIPEGAVFVLGDNRDDSADSRSRDIGVIDHDEIVGRAFVVFWPLSDLRWL